AASSKAMSCNPDSGFTATAECTGHMAPTVRAATSTATSVSGEGCATTGWTRPRTRWALSITTGRTSGRSQPRATAYIPAAPDSRTVSVRAIAAVADHTPSSGKIRVQTPSRSTYPNSPASTTIDAHARPLAVECAAVRRSGHSRAARAKVAAAAATTSGTRSTTGHPGHVTAPRATTSAVAAGSASNAQAGIPAKAGTAGRRDAPPARRNSQAL